MHAEIARDVLGISRPCRMIDTVPCERCGRLCRAGKPSEVSAEPAEEIAHILLAVIAKIRPRPLNLLLREAIRHLVMLRIVHDDQMQHPTFLQIARRLLQEIIVQPRTHPEKEMEIRRRTPFLPAIHTVDSTHAYLRLFHIRCTAACEHPHAQDVGVNCNLHLLHCSRIFIQRDARTISSTPSAVSCSSV